MTTPPPPHRPWWMDQPPPPRALPPPPSPPAAATSRPRAGWYHDPWSPGDWRWWDGHSWTAHAAETTEHEVRRPRLPSFLSVPVLTSAVPSIGLIALGAITAPIAIALGLVPFLVVVPVLVWMDRLEPEPWSARVHALLWGAFVAGAVSLVVNTIVALGLTETAAAVFSAPIIEEVTKAGAIVWAVRRGEVDGIMDGLVYAGWAALGFAVVEDFAYFVAAVDDDLLVETFIARALFTPFAHPLFTAWTGLAIGIAVRTRRPLASAWWGLALAIASHAVWNGSLALAESDGGLIVVGVTVLGFVALFLATAIGVVVLRGRDRSRLRQLLPYVAQRYGVPPDRFDAVADLRVRRRTRRGLPEDRRRSFDLEVSTVVRLAALFDHPGAPDPSEEARLVAQLERARRPAPS